MTVTRIRIRITTTPYRKPPALGDRRTTKKHGEQIRIFEPCRAGMLVNSRGKPFYCWVDVADLPERYSYLLKR